MDKEKRGNFVILSKTNDFIDLETYPPESSEAGTPMIFPIYSVAENYAKENCQLWQVIELEKKMLL